MKNKKKFILILAFFFESTGSLYPQVFNNSFEDWHNGLPDYWELADRNSNFGVQQSTSAHSGNYSMRLFSHINNPAHITLQGLYMLKNSPWFRVPLGCNAFSFWYTCNASSNVIPNYQCLGKSFATSKLLNTNQWTKYSIKFSSSNSPDTMRIQFQAYLQNQDDANYDLELNIDDITFDTITADVHYKRDFLSCEIIPNPISTIGSIHYNSELDAKPKFTLFDIMGKKLNIFPYFIVRSNALETFDVSELPNGVYYLRIEYGENSLLRKIIVLH
jgi:hypothetical protein